MANCDKAKGQQHRASGSASDGLMSSFQSVTAAGEHLSAAPQSIGTYTTNEESVKLEGLTSQHYGRMLPQEYYYQTSSSAYATFPTKLYGIALIRRFGNGPLYKYK